MTDVVVRVTGTKGTDTDLLFPGSTQQKGYVAGGAPPPYDYWYWSIPYRNGSFATQADQFMVDVDSPTIAGGGVDLGGNFRSWFFVNSQATLAGTVSFFANDTANSTTVPIGSIKMVTLDGIAGTLAITDTLHTISIFGNIGNDTLRGSFLNDTIFGDQGRDSVLAGSGDDFVVGQQGRDRIDGGQGSDYASYSDKTKAVTVTLNGSHWVNVKVGGKVEDTIKNIEDIWGGRGNDRLTGDRQNNTLVGEGGSNTLIGGNGHDGLWAGDGRNTMTGGSGSDTFVLKDPPQVASEYGHPARVQLITDFNHKNDNIFIDVILSFGNPQLDPTFFSGDLTNDGNDYFLYQKSSGKLFYDSDPGGAGGMVQIAQLGTGHSHPHLDASDFFWI